MRHAKSDWPDDVEDHERPLAARGQRDAPHVGETLAEKDFLPDRILVSSAQRTQETYALLAPSFPKAAMVTVPAIYEALPDQILDEIRKTPASIATLMVIGHNPGLELLAGMLLREEDRDAFHRGYEKFPTAAAMVLAIDGGTWGDVAEGCGRLELFLRPRDLD